MSTDTPELPSDRPTALNFGPIGTAFPAGDPLAEWVVTIALAANDLQILNERILLSETADDSPATYQFRVVLSHFFEIGDYLHAHRRLPAVVEFVSAMGDDADGYHVVLATFDRNKPVLAAIRNNSGFHYGPTTPGSKKTILRRALRAAADSPGQLFLNIGPTGLEFAREIEAAIFTLAAGASEPGGAALGDLLTEVGTAVGAFIPFALEASGHFLAHRSIGVEVESLPSASG